jgi:hypothetical protein
MFAAAFAFAAIHRSATVVRNLVIFPSQHVDIRLGNR